MNISEFAEYAGVSKSAVSRYFNNGYLSDDKREKIEKAIENLSLVARDNQQINKIVKELSGG